MGAGTIKTWNYLLFSKKHQSALRIIPAGLLGEVRIYTTTQGSRLAAVRMDSNAMKQANPNANRIANYPTGSRLVFLDALRFVAAAAVVFQHVIEVSGSRGAAIAAALSPGVFGVVLFFIISGFSISLAADKHFDIRKFLVRRIFRIYPLVLATFATIIVLAYSNLLPGLAYVKDASSRDWFANILLVQDFTGALSLWGVTWTLSLELAWYLVFAMALLTFKARFDKYLIVIAPVFLLTLAVISLLLDQRLPLARPGMLYAAIFGARAYRHLIGLVSRRRISIDFIVFVAVMAGCNVISFGYFSHPKISLSQAMYPWFAASLFFTVTVLTPRVRQGKLLNNRLVGWFGQVSYSTYLLHPLAIIIAHDYAPTSMMAIGSIVLTLVLSVFGYYLIESPAQKFGSRVASALGRRNIKGRVSKKEARI